MTKHMIEAGKPATKLKSEALAVLLERGLVHQCTDIEALDEEAFPRDRSRPTPDSTPPRASLHVGHLMPLMTMRWLQKLGHRRSSFSAAAPARSAIRAFATMPDRCWRSARSRPTSPPSAARSSGWSTWTVRTVPCLVDNAEWLNEFRFLEFLRDYGSQFTVNRMMTFDSVKSRLDAQMPLTVLEFCYMMLQAVDFLELAKRHDCVLQVGGSDQWGNIVNGVELGRRDGRKLHGLTVPLADHRKRSQDGQDRRGRRLAASRTSVPLRLLAILAQHGRRRRWQNSCVCSRNCRSVKSKAPPRLKERNSTKPRRSWQPR